MTVSGGEPGVGGRVLSPKLWHHLTKSEGVESLKKEGEYTILLITLILQG